MMIVIDYLLQKVRAPKTNLKNHPSQTELFPTVHGAICNEKTLCGLFCLNQAWYILKVGFDWNPIKIEEITCKKCLKNLKK